MKPNDSISIARSKDAKAKSAFYAGRTDSHPHGMSGRKWVLPPEDSKGCWDTAPHALRFSEWGNAAGSIADNPK